MKFLLVPLLIVVMFISFVGAFVAMLFVTDTISSPQELKDMIVGTPDSTSLAEEFMGKDDKLAELYRLAEEYKEMNEQELERTKQLHDSLLAEGAKLGAQKDSLLQREKELEQLADSSFQAQRDATLKDMAKFYQKIKAPAAAQILQEESGMGDTTVARLIQQLSPGQAGKIMGAMDTQFAARISKIMQEIKTSSP